MTSLDGLTIDDFWEEAIDLLTVKTNDLANGLQNIDAAQIVSNRLIKDRLPTDTIYATSYLNASLLVAGVDDTRAPYSALPTDLVKYDQVFGGGLIWKNILPEIPLAKLPQLDVYHMPEYLQFGIVERDGVLINLLNNNHVKIATSMLDGSIATSKLSGSINADNITGTLTNAQISANNIFDYVETPIPNNFRVDHITFFSVYNGDWPMTMTRHNLTSSSTYQNTIHRLYENFSVSAANVIDGELSESVIPWYLKPTKTLLNTTVLSTNETNLNQSDNSHFYDGLWYNVYSANMVNEELKTYEYVLDHVKIDYTNVKNTPVLPTSLTQFTNDGAGNTRYAKMSDIVNNTGDFTFNQHTNVASNLYVGSNLFVDKNIYAHNNLYVSNKIFVEGFMHGMVAIGDV